MSNPIKNRYDFVLVFDVQDGNPNGDPDAGNLPRVDSSTGHGLVTDVCLKRKIRNFVMLAQDIEPNDGRKAVLDIYVKEKAVLGDAHFAAFEKLGISTGEESRKNIPPDLDEGLSELELPDGLTVDKGEDGQSSQLIVAADADKKVISAWLKDENPDKSLAQFIKIALRDAKPRKPTADETRKGRQQMCNDYYDIRTFGAVLSLKSAPNCGQVRGPVQMTFARSRDPIVSMEHSITRMAVATQAEAAQQSGDNCTMGRKNTVPYGLYVSHGFVSAHLANQTGFNEEDLSLLWEALVNMFEHDRSAARGLMATRKLFIFKHDSALGSAPAHSLFDRISIVRKDASKPARAFSDYEVAVDKSNLPTGVEIIERP